MISRNKFILIFVSFSLLAGASIALGAYGDYDGTLPAWLDQSESSADGNFVIHYTDDTHHSAPFVGNPDTDGDNLPDTWETFFWGNISSGQNSDPDADGYTNLAEFQDGSWPDDDYFRPDDTISPAANASGQNLIAQDVIDTLVFCEGRYAAWGFNAPWGLPLNVHIRYTPYGGWGNVNPLWCSPDIVTNLADPDRKTVAIHELFHNVQRAYPDTPGATDWFIEGSARMSQDFFYLDNDLDPGSQYAGQISGFLGDHDSTGIFERSYDAVFFWKYLCEQTGKTIVGQPWEGFDAMHRYMVSSSGFEADDSVQEYLNDLDPGDFWYRKAADHFFATWTTALYTRRFSAASLSPLYFYRDEQENLPASLARPVKISNCPYSAATDSYTPEAVPLNGSVLYNDMDTGTWTRHLGTWRSRYYAFEPAAAARIVIVWVDGETGQRNYYATVTSRAGDVDDISFNYGEDLVKAYFNNAIDEVGVVVTALDEEADFDVMIWTLSDFWINITYPQTDNPERVRVPEAGELSTFEVHVKVWTEKSENPDDDIYVDGLSPDLFEVYVDGQPAAVLSGYQMMDEYWLACQAPDLGPGEYDLEVRLADRSDTEIKALLYEERPHVDRMIVIDRSGSMGSELMGNNEKMLAAKSGGRLYTDLLVDDDMLGLVSFGGDAHDDPANATLHESLAIVSDLYKNQVKDAIDNDITDDPSQYEHTAMGQGILAGYDQLVTRGDPDHEWRMALLTDGMEDRSPYWADAAVSGVVVPSEVKIDAIALGSGAHEFLLNSVAQDTEGNYFHVSVPMSSSRAASVDPLVENRLADVFRRISERDMDHTRIWSEEGYADVSKKTVFFAMYEGMEDLVLTVNWPLKSPLSYKLYTPSGGSVSPRYVSKTHAVYHLPVISGKWELQISAAVKTPYLAVLSGYGNLKSKLFFTRPENSLKIGAVRKICFSLISGNGKPEVTHVNATVTAPSGRQTSYGLFDDGDHGDTVSGDHIFSRDYRLTPDYGSYDVKVVAEGNDGKYPFRIEENGSFVVVGDYDRDKDGMPDEWERRYGLNPSEDDAHEDRDEDGISNLKEFENGGNPSDDDTDNGGTQDGSELMNGMDMLDFSDDLIAPPSSLVINRQPTDALAPDFKFPQPNANLLYWSRGSNYHTVDIYRSDSLSGPYSLVESSVPASDRPYEDTGLTNGKKYYYQIAAKTKAGIMTRRSKSAMGMPKSDNIAPFGHITIGGPGNVVTPFVTLKPKAADDTAWMRFSNTPDFDGSSWEAYQPTRANWKIGGRYGVNFVFAQFMDSAENISLTFQDSVVYQKDKDADGLGDNWEFRYFGNLLQKGNGDPDKDGLENIGEFGNDTNPRNQDSDGDGIADGWEVKMGLYPTLNDAVSDPDKDGYTNIEEAEGGTDPLDPKSHPAGKRGDVDGDGKITLADAIVSLKICSEIRHEGISLHGDVDGDGLIGISEAIYVLQHMAGLRDSQND